MMVSGDGHPRLLFRRRSAARALDISVRTIDCAIAAGLLETRRIDGQILIPAEFLAKFAATDQVIPGAPANGWGGRRSGAGRKPSSKSNPRASSVAVDPAVPKSP